VIEETLRVEGGRVLATLTRLTGSLDRAEDALGEAVLVALERWPVDGVPRAPAAWLTTVARRKALDQLRREAQRTEREAEALRELTALADDPLPSSVVEDDLLRLVFTCCHPALAPAARVALSLRLLCGLTTEEIARAFLEPSATLGQRISRAKAKIAAARIPYRVPDAADLPERLDAVLAVVYVMFTTGHHSPMGESLHRVDLAREAIRLARLLVALLPGEPECVGLLALLLSAHARSHGRMDDLGQPRLLADADRSRWDHDAIREAVTLTGAALRAGCPGPYQLQAAISCLHSVAPSVDATDWPQIVQLYDLLLERVPTLAVRVNRAVAVAQVDGPAVGLALLDALRDERGAATWHLYHAVRADLLRRLGEHARAATAYREALACELNAVDRRFLEARLRAVG
jgi:RNA polymerase sigma-70 factor (ECF subfamily)